MTPYYADEAVTLHHGDCLDVLRTLPDASVDAVVTDPPYGLEFMGKDWDAPWQKGSGVGGHSAGFAEKRYKDGSTALIPTFTGNTNPTCRNCGGLRNGREGKKGQQPCRCGDPKFDNTTLPRMVAFQHWCEQWAAECLRVLKPGGVMVAFGGTRTVHRLTCAIEDAGFEIRDSIMWHYASGFPKSLNVNKDARFCQCQSIDWPYGSEAGFDPLEQDGSADMPGVRQGVSPVADQASGQPTPRMLPQVSRGEGPGPLGRDCLSGQGRLDGSLPHLLSAEDERGAEPGLEGRGNGQAAEGQLRRAGVRALPGGLPGDGADGRLRDGAPAGDGPSDRSAAAAVGGGQPHRPQPPEQRPGEPGAVSVERGSQAGRGWPVCGGCGKPSVPAGLGTALKPATEPIVVARKPLAGTVAANVLAYGTGALNIGDCRVGDGTDRTSGGRQGSMPQPMAWGETTGRERPEGGRWPSNVVLSHAPDCGDPCVPGCPVAELDRQSGITRSPGAYAPTVDRSDRSMFGIGGVNHDREFGDSGGASRFFPVFRYEAKAPTAERPRTPDGTAHPTVKPLDLMRWLVRLVAPAGGVVLEPFAGSGTTAEACVLEGFRCIAIEREAAYLPLIVARLTKPLQPSLDLFGGVA